MHVAVNNHPRVSLVSIIAVGFAVTAVLVLIAGGPAAVLVSSAVALLTIAGLIRPSVPVAAIALSVPLQSQLAVSIDDRIITWTKIAVFAAVLAACARFIVGDAKLKLTGIAFAFGAYVLVLNASIVNAQDLDAWAGEVYRWGIAFLVYLIAVEATQDDRFLPFVTLAMSVAVIGASVAGFYQAFVHVGPKTFGANGLTRAYSAFGEPNPFAAYLEMSVLLLVAIVLVWLVPVKSLRAAKRPEQWFVAIVSGSVAIGSLALLLSQSRGGFLGFVAGMATIAWLAFAWARWAIVAAVFALIFLILIPPFGPRIRGRLVESVGNPSAQTQVTTDNFAVQERIAHWRAGLAMWGDYPVLGVGAGNYPDRFREETQVWRFRISRGHAHSSYIQAGAQAGLAGFLGYLTLLSVAILTCIRRLNLSGSDYRGVAIGAVGVTLAVMIHGLFDYLHVLSLGLQLSIVWAMVELGSRSNAPRWPRLRALGSRV
jgi:putative inorganic carbon (HCO3(-)) transporter